MKMPERKEVKTLSDALDKETIFREGWNACWDAWEKYHKQEVIKARIEELNDLPFVIGEDLFDWSDVHNRIAALQAELREGK